MQPWRGHHHHDADHAADHARNDHCADGPLQLTGRGLCFLGAGGAGAQAQAPGPERRLGRLRAGAVQGRPGTSLPS